ncbi:MAG: hypothetical protein AB7S38_04950 [Vulcanimicrobiota bacterium]
MKHALDEIGLEPRQGLAGLNYEGDYRGRFTRIHCSARTRTSGGEVRNRSVVGLKLEIIMDTPVKSRLVLAPRGGKFQAWLAKTNRWFGTRPCKAPEGIEAWAAEPDWAERLLADQPLPTGGVRLWPEHLTVTRMLPPTGVPIEDVRQAMERMADLLDTIEAEPPGRVCETAWIERQSPMVLAGVLLGGVLVVSTGFSIGLVALAIMVAKLL